MKTKFFSLLLILCFFLLGSCSKENLQLNNETKPDAFEQLRQDISALNQKFFATPSYQKDYIGDYIPLGEYPFDEETLSSRYRINFIAQMAYFKAYSWSEDWSYSAAIASIASWWTAINHRQQYDNEYDPTFIYSENPINPDSSYSIDYFIVDNDPGALHNQIVQEAFTEIEPDNFLDINLSGIKDRVKNITAPYCNIGYYYMYEEDAEWASYLLGIGIRNMYDMSDYMDNIIYYDINGLIIASEEMDILKDYIEDVFIIPPRQAKEYTIQFAEVIESSDIPQFSKELLLGTLSIGLNNSVLWNMQLPDPDNADFLITFNNEMNISQLFIRTPNDFYTCTILTEDCKIAGTIRDPVPPCSMNPDCGVIHDFTLYIYDYLNPNVNLSFLESGSYHVEETVLLEHSYNEENIQIQINEGSYSIHDWNNGEIKIIKFTSPQ